MGWLVLLAYWWGYRSGERWGLSLGRLQGAGDVLRELVDADARRVGS